MSTALSSSMNSKLAYGFHDRLYDAIDFANKTEHARVNPRRPSRFPDLAAHVAEPLRQLTLDVRDLLCDHRAVGPLQLLWAHFVNGRLIPSLGTARHARCKLRGLVTRQNVVFLARVSVTPPSSFPVRIPHVADPRPQYHVQCGHDIPGGGTYLDERCHSANPAARRSHTLPGIPAAASGERWIPAAPFLFLALFDVPRQAMTAPLGTRPWVA